MEFRILGPLEVSAGDGTIKLGGPKQRALLGHLILRANHVVPAERLIDALWGDDPPDTARNTLQTYVYRLRKALGDERVASESGGYVLRADPEEIDAGRFEALVKRAKGLAAFDPEDAAGTWADALAIWRGAPLADLAEEASLQGEIARLEELHLSATEHRIAAEIAMGGHSTVVSELEALTSRYPLRERMWANLILALYRLGRQAEALAAYQRAREVLADELGTEPSPELQRLHERILLHDPSLGHRESPRSMVRPSREDLKPGTEVAGYRIVRTLGRGGMSVVYLAEHDWLQRKVALKVLAPQLAEDERFRDRFVRESRLAASLDHPNVIPIYEAGASGGDLFIAMRFVEGTDLKTLLHEERALEPARAVAIVRQVAAALDVAHEEGLVHRDVKPANVLLARQRGSEAGEHVYLSDFGLTKRSASDSGVTGTGQFVGTLDYAAPEQFKGGTPDARTDVYSLGCVLFECLSGHPPFRAENDAGLMYAHLQEAPTAVTADRPDLPRDIDRVIAKAMAKAPGDRYQTAGTLADEAARALGTIQPAPERSRSRLRLLAVAGALGVAVVAGVVVSSLFRGEPPGSQGETRTGSASSPSPTVAPSFATVDRALTADEQRLKASIPEDVGADCSPLDQPELAPEELAALVCGKADVEVLYELFSTRTAMDGMFQGAVNRTQAPDGECAADRLAVTPYSVGGQPTGSVLCYTVKAGPSRQEVGEPSRSHIEWTDENALIYAHAIRNDLGDLTLYQWWLSSGGPRITSEDGTTLPVKDAPPGSVRLPDGTYLAAGPNRFTSYRHPTFAVHLEDESYRITINGYDTVETGDLLLRKPKAVVFTPRTGFCLGSDHDPGVYTWSTSEGLLSFERAGGGRCAGPQQLVDGPWTRAHEGRIAVSQGGEIEIVDGGGNLIRSTTDEHTNPSVAPDWSPDGSRIAFAGASEHGFDLYVMDADGSGLRRITKTAGDEETPAWSPDGTRLAFSFGDESGLAVIEPDGQARTELVTRNSGTVWDPIWSPDGREIVFTIFLDGPKMYVLDADSGQVRPLPGSEGIALTWTPDGRIVFASHATGHGPNVVTGETALMSKEVDGSGERMLLEDLPADISRPFVDLSPDGKWILLSNWWNNDTPNAQGVYLVRDDDGRSFRITSGTEATWRPVTD